MAKKNVTSIRVWWSTIKDIDKAAKLLADIRNVPESAKPATPEVIHVVLRAFIQSQKRKAVQSLAVESVPTVPVTTKETK